MVAEKIFRGGADISLNLKAIYPSLCVKFFLEIGLDQSRKIFDVRVLEENSSESYEKNFFKTC